MLLLSAKAIRSLNFLHIVLVQLNLLHINVLCGLLCSILVQFGSSTAKNVNTLEYVQLCAAGSRWNTQEILQIKKEKRVRKAEKAKPKFHQQEGARKNKVTDAATLTNSVAAVTLSESVSHMTDITTDGAAIVSASVTVTSVASTSIAPCTSVRGHETSIGVKLQIQINTACALLVMKMTF